MERFKDLLVAPDPDSPVDPERCAARLRWALEMSDFGLGMMRQNLARKHPDETPAQLEERLEVWLLRRSDAPEGDGWGVSAGHRFDF